MNAIVHALAQTRPDTAFFMLAALLIGGALGFVAGTIIF